MTSHVSACVQECFAHIDTAMGGKAAEELIFGIDKVNATLIRQLCLPDLLVCCRNCDTLMCGWSATAAKRLMGCVCCPADDDGRHVGPAAGDTICAPYGRRVRHVRGAGACVLRPKPLRFPIRPETPATVLQQDCECGMFEELVLVLLAPLHFYLQYCTRLWLCLSAPALSQGAH